MSIIREFKHKLIEVSHFSCRVERRVVGTGLPVLCRSHDWNSFGQDPYSPPHAC